MHLVEIIVTFQTACATNLDLTFHVGFSDLHNEKYLYKSESMLRKNVQENVDLGEEDPRKEAASICYCDFNKPLPLIV